jgi:hypothetical protein
MQTRVQHDVLVTVLFFLDFAGRMPLAIRALTQAALRFILSSSIHTTSFAVLSGASPCIYRKLLNIELAQLAGCG